MINNTNSPAPDSQVPPHSVEAEQAVLGGIFTRDLEITEMSRSLKALAKELDVPVIAISQMNRSVERRDNKNPMLSDLRESGAIEQDADIIMFVNRPSMLKPKGDRPHERPLVDPVQIIIAKHRNGETGSVNLLFHAAYNSFEEAAPEQGGHI